MGKGLARRARIERATCRLEDGCSDPIELRAESWPPVSDSNARPPGSTSERSERRTSHCDGLALARDSRSEQARNSKSTELTGEN